MGFFNNMPQDDSESSANKMIFGIICVTVLGFILVHPSVSVLSARLILTPAAVYNLELWRIVSSLLVNASGFNLFFEMYVLYIFGTIISRRLGAGKLLSLYLCSGIMGNLLWLAVNLKAPAGACAYGCSGAVYGIIMAAAMLAPELQMYLLFIPFPIKLRTLAVVFIILDLLLSGISPLALLYVGGFLGGYLFTRIFLRKEVQWDPLDFLTRREPSVRGGTPYEFKQKPKAGPNVSFDRNEIDRILDKLSRTGINSLTPEEVAVLEKVREQMNRKE
ncbi:MAG: rhomboid family intramembrane serine protease [Lentisphaeria bacterium]|nr:rhomboid family intramembrane serine protease [Lentisphaeria bacterium]